MSEEYTHHLSILFGSFCFFICPCEYCAKWVLYHLGLVPFTFVRDHVGFALNKLLSGLSLVWVLGPKICYSPYFGQQRMVIGLSVSFYPSCYPIWSPNHQQSFMIVIFSNFLYLLDFRIQHIHV